MAYKIGKVAKLAGVSRMQVWRLASGGLIPAARRTKGGQFYFSNTPEFRGWLDAAMRNLEQKDRPLSVVSRLQNNRHKQQRSFTQINQLWDAFTEVSQEWLKETLEITNQLRRVGTMLQTVSNRDRITFELYRSFEPHLPAGFTFEDAKACVSVARFLTEDIRTLGELQRAWHLVRPMLSRLEQPAQNSPSPP